MINSFWSGAAWGISALGEMERYIMAYSEGFYLDINNFNGLGYSFGF